MKNKILCIILFILVIIYCIEGSLIRTPSFFSNEENASTEKASNKTITIIDKKDNTNITLDFDDYLIGVIAAEMPASFSIEALKAQAVASRTYAYFKINNNSNLTTDISTQSYITIEQMKEKWQDDFDIYYNKIKKAVNETSDEVLTYDGNIIPAYFFAMSNGYTEDASIVFKEDKPYLKSVESKENEDNRNFKQTKTISKSDFCTLLNISCDEIVIDNITKTTSNRINNININNTTFSGVDIRKKLNLRSTDFEISIDDDINITTYGYGHGVGMSQYGANTMAKDGYNYKEILLHYYNGVSLEKM